MLAYGPSLGVFSSEPVSALVFRTSHVATSAASQGWDGNKSNPIDFDEEIQPGPHVLCCPVVLQVLHFIPKRETSSSRDEVKVPACLFLHGEQQIGHLPDITREIRRVGHNHQWGRELINNDASNQMKHAPDVPRPSVE